MTQLFSNNATTQLSADIDNVTTTIVVSGGGGAGFTLPVDPDFEIITVVGGSGTEIMKVIARSTDTFTVVRAQEGTTGLSFVSGDVLEARITAATLDSFAGGFDPDTDEIVIGTSATTAVDSNGVAIGVSATADGSDSISLGRFSYTGPNAGNGIALSGGTAEGNASIAIGPNSSSKTQGCVAIGFNAVAESTSGISIGEGAKGLDNAMTTGGIAIGDNAKVNGDNSICIGTDTFGTNGATEGVAIGFGSQANATSVVAIGKQANAGSLDSISIGTGAGAGSVNGIAIGKASYLTGGDNRISIGTSIENRVDSSHIIAGPSLVKKDNNEAAGTESLQFVGQENYQFSKEIDLKVLGDEVVSIAYPLGSKYFVGELGLVLTDASGVTLAPQVSFGIIGSTELLLGATLAGGTSTNERDIFIPLNINGQQSVTMSVKVAATGTTCKGRVYFKGFLLEEE